MYRLILLLGVILFPKVAEAQSITFNMHDGRNAKYVVMVDVSNQTLSVSKDGSSLFSKRYYGVKDQNGMIGFSFVQDKEPIMAFSENEQFFLITKEAIIYNKITSGQSLIFLDADDVSSFVDGYNQLINDLDTSIKTFTVNGVKFNMVRVEGGTFWMGNNFRTEEYDDRSQPRHQVVLSSYMIGETEVTQELWQAVMGGNPSKYTGNMQRPVECVSWEDCQTFLGKLYDLTGMMFRLPTEAEWEFAARGGNKSKGYQFSGSDTISDVASRTVHDGTNIVKKKNKNELGIYDMSGNVREWCNDWYSKYGTDIQYNPQGPFESPNYCRVCRGGGWNGNVMYSRVSYREYFQPNLRFGDLGFRLAL